MKTRSILIAYILLIATTLFWGGNFVVGRAVSAEIPPLALSWWRWAFALIIILPFSLHLLWKKRHILRRDWLYLLFVSFLGVCNFNSFVYLGLQTSPATDALLLLSACPVMILLLSRFIYGVRISYLQITGVTLSLIGVMTIITEGSISHFGALLSGNQGRFWILAAVFSWALYSVLLRKRSADLTGLEFFSITAILGLALITPFYLYEHFIQHRHIAFNTTSISTLIYVSVFASVLAFLFWNQGVQVLGANQTGYFIHLIPVWGILLASLFLNEKLYVFHWVGMVLIFSGIAMATRLSHKRAHA
ncbi:MULTISPECIES: DMT family transporter [Nitrincola]|uniref:Putative amino-acid metabolite efflux pump n=1 Tax=Nitrincola nitratireducens TaxID=1229521 RepID=W9V7K8_9GAMM|nr:MULTISPECIES: DMT family transporter [Nitrincola]EXJ12082.1 putative amino-acid metabolite efflux pump [Nitrincola nitratireducens]